MYRYGEPAQPLGKDTCAPVYPDSAFKHAAAIKKRGKEIREGKAGAVKSSSAATTTVGATVAGAASYLARAVPRAMPVVSSLIAADGGDSAISAENSTRGFGGSAALFALGFVGAAAAYTWRRRRRHRPSLIPTSDYPPAAGVSYTEFTPAAPTLD